MTGRKGARFGGNGANESDLPPWFVHPTPERGFQYTLFPRPLPDLLAELRVRTDELQRWHEAGWLSFGPDRTEPLEDWDSNEIRFVRDVVRSGLSDAMTAAHFEQLPRPMNFDPKAVAYSFSLGGVMARTEPPPGPSDVVDEHVDQWLLELAEADDRVRLETIQDRIQGLLASVRDGWGEDPR